MYIYKREIVFLYLPIFLGEKFNFSITYQKVGCTFKCCFCLQTFSGSRICILKFLALLMIYAIIDICSIYKKIYCMYIRRKKFVFLKIKTIHIYVYIYRYIYIDYH